VLRARLLYAIETCIALDADYRVAEEEEEEAAAAPAQAPPPPR
jgi:hypothetical protein